MDEGGGRVLGAAEGGGDGPKQQQLVESFCGITSASPEEALFFLESHNWQLDAAIHSFYDNDDHELPAAAEAPVGHLPPPPLRRQQRREEAEEDEGDDDDEDYVPESLGRRVPSPPVVAARDSKKKKAKSSTGSSRPTGGIRTLADLNRQPSGSESDSDDDGPQEYYTGGEKSGMLVQDPSKGKNNIDDLFEQARQRGATQGPFENPRPSGPRSFTGTGRLLSGDTVPAAPQPQQPENIVHNITFWTNGFTIDDGPLRSFDDPDNASFLESIKKSECPRELAPENKRSTVHVNLIRREEKCPEPVKPRVPFKGVGRTLSSGSTARVESSGSSADTAIAGEPSSSIGLSVDETLPSTSIQLRLADGTRMVARFNNHHTVGDIRSFIDASRPGATRTYQLQTVGFPPKQLTDVTQTIEQAGLASSVVIQRL